MGRAYSKLKPGTSTVTGLFVTCEFSPLERLIVLFGMFTPGFWLTRAFAVAGICQVSPGFPISGKVTAVIPTDTAVSFHDSRAIDDPQLFNVHEHNEYETLKLGGIHESRVPFTA